MENYMFGAQGNFALGFKFQMPEKYSLGENDFDLLNDYWNKALRDLPTGTIFFKQDIFSEDKFDAKKFPKRNFLERKTKDYFNGMEYISHDTNVFFILPNTSIQLSKLKNPIRPPQKQMFTEFDDKIKNFISSVSQVINYLRSVKLSGNNQFKIQPLSKEYLNTYYEYINSGLNKDYSVDIRNEWDFLKVGSKYATILKFPQENKFPESLKSCRADADLSNDKIKFFRNYGDNFSHDLGFTHIYNQIAVLDDNKYHYNQAQNNHNDLHKFRRFDKTNEFWAEQTGDMLKEMARHSDTERIVRAHNNIVIFADTESDLINRIESVTERFKDIDIKPERPFGDNLTALYEFSYPLNAHLFVDDHYYIANLEVFSSFLTCSGKYNNDKEGLRFNSRLSGMVPVTVDVWDEDKNYVDARNFFILSPTGGGKSFTANHIISHYYSDGAKQVIIDLGGSYRKLEALFPNDIAYITYKEGDNLGVNPFEMREGEVLTTAKIDELVEFIGVHFRRDGTLSEQERAVLRRVVELYYKNIKKGHSLPSFINSFIIDKNDIIDHLEIQKEFFNADEFVLLMSEFVDTGAYSFLYNDSKPTFGTELYEKNIIVFELDAIRGNKLLLSIMLQLISTTIDKMIWQDKSTRGVILFDEVAEQLKWDGMLRRIQWFYQAIRKQNGSIGIVLQSIAQLPKNELSDAIIDNTQILYVLGAKDYKAIQERFNLSDHAYYQMSSIKKNFSGDRKYSQLFLLRGDTHQVYNLEVPPEVFWAYQTDGAMNTLLLKAYDITNNMEIAIQIMIENQAKFEQIRDDLKGRKIDEEESINIIKRIAKNYQYEKEIY